MAKCCIGAWPNHVEAPIAPDDGRVAMAHGIEAIDWNMPWLQPWRARGQPLAERVAKGDSCAQALNILAQGMPDCPVRFVPQSDLPPGQAYEAFIFQTQQVHCSF